MLVFKALGDCDLNGMKGFELLSVPFDLFNPLGAIPASMDELPLVTDCVKCVFVHVAILRYFL